MCAFLIIFIPDDVISGICLHNSGAPDRIVYLYPANDEHLCVGVQMCECGCYFFPQPRRDVLIAEVVWFFRVQEVPESLYLLLQEDRKSGWLLGTG